MTDLPEPLTPPDCDLRGLEWMPFFGHRLFMSEFETRATDAEFRAAIRLWWMSWNQVPAGSLPNDDALLCKLAGLGRDIKEWKRIRAGNVLHGFILCSDGRLYHTLISEEAADTYEKRIKSNEKREKERERLAAWREAKRLKALANKSGNGGGDDTGNNGGSDNGNTDRNDSETQSATLSETVHETRFETSKTGQDRTGQDRTKKERVEVAANAPPPPALVPERTKRANRLPPDWQPTQGDRTFALDLGLNVQSVAAGFRDYWHAKAGKDAAKLDWSATWRNWCRKEKPSTPTFRNGFAELLAEPAARPVEDELPSFLRVSHVPN
jgi:Protein of unknown function (DUF1376)